MASIGSLINYFATANESGTLTLTSSISSGAATVPVTNLSSNYSNGDRVALVIEPGLSTQQVFFGTVSGGNVINAVWTEGSNVAHSAGATVIDYWTATHQAALVAGILKEHTQTGTHNAITGVSAALTGNGSFGGTLGVTGATTLSAALSVTGDETHSGHIYGGDGSSVILPGLDYTLSGGVWSQTSGLSAGMTAWKGVIGGKYYAIAAVAARAFTASKDTYVDINPASSGSLVYTEVANAAAAPALTSGYYRLGMVPTSGAAVGTVNNGTVITTAFDSLGNRIHRTNPMETLLGYAQITTSPTTTSTTYAALSTALGVTVLVPSTTTPIRITHRHNALNNNTNGDGVGVSIWDGVVNSGTELEEGLMTSSTAGFNQVAPIDSPVILGVSGSKTYNVGMKAVGGGTATMGAAATAPAFIAVYKV